jgi:hypothetical protein
VADALGGAAVEAERVLVEAGGEVLLAHRAVVGAQEPALDEAEDEVDAGQPERGVALVQTQARPCARRPR